MQSRRYTVTVSRRLGPQFLTVFPGVLIKPAAVGQTRLTTDSFDQGQLYGLLRRLNDFGLELVSVEAPTLMFRRKGKLSSVEASPIKDAVQLSTMIRPHQFTASLLASVCAGLVRDPAAGINSLSPANHGAGCPADQLHAYRADRRAVTGLRQRRRPPSVSVAGDRVAHRPPLVLHRGTDYRAARSTGLDHARDDAAARRNVDRGRALRDVRDSPDLLPDSTGKVWNLDLRQSAAGPAQSQRD